MGAAARIRKFFIHGVTGLVSGGVLFGVSCNVDRLRALADGLNEVARTLDAANPDDDISFGEWLVQELED